MQEELGVGGTHESAHRRATLCLWSGRLWNEIQAIGHFKGFLFNPFRYSFVVTFNNICIETQFMIAPPAFRSLLPRYTRDSTLGRLHFSVRHVENHLSKSVTTRNTWLNTILVNLFLQARLLMFGENKIPKGDEMLAVKTCTWKYESHINHSW